MRLEADRTCATCGGVVKRGTENWMIASGTKPNWGACMKCGKVAHYECLNQEKGGGMGLWCKSCRAEKALTT